MKYKRKTRKAGRKDTNNTKNMATKTICKDGMSYVAPVLEVLNLKTEGVLCASIGIKDWERDDEVLGTN